MVYSASLVGLLRTLFVISMIFLGIRLLVRYVFPLVGKWAFKKAEKKMYEQAQQQYQNRGSNFRSGRKEEVISDDGSVKISKPNNADQGEFTDYEEVE